MITLARLLRTLWDLIVILYATAMLGIILVGVPAAFLWIVGTPGGIVPWLQGHIQDLGLPWPTSRPARSSVYCAPSSRP